MARIKRVIDQVKKAVAKLFKYFQQNKSCELNMAENQSSFVINNLNREKLKTKEGTFYFKSVAFI